MKGVVLSLAPEAQLVDITHGDPAAGRRRRARSRWRRRRRCSRRGTIHVAVVDPGVGGARADVVVDVGRQSLHRARQRRAVAGGARRRARSTGSRRPRSGASRSARRSTAATSSRRPRAAWRPGRVAADVGPPLSTHGRAGSAAAAPGWAASSRARVIHVDSFGNLMTSLPAERPVSGAPAREVEVEVEGARGRSARRSGKTFADVAAGRAGRLHRQRGQLEIALRDGSAAASTGRRAGQPVRLTERRS